MTLNDRKVPVRIETVVQPWLHALMAFADDKQYPLILSLDANARTEWYGTETNSRGGDFEEFITQHNLLLKNRGVSGHLPFVQTWCSCRIPHRFHTLLEPHNFARLARSGRGV